MDEDLEICSCSYGLKFIIIYLYVIEWNLKTLYIPTIERRNLTASETSRESDGKSDPGGN